MPEHPKKKTNEHGKVSSMNDSDNAETDPSEATDLIELGGQEGPEPTRFGDWERKGRCIDF